MASSRKTTTYDDILQKMGMVVINGQLVTIPAAAAAFPNSGAGTGAGASASAGGMEQSYIYNKYFRDTSGAASAAAAANSVPRTPEELRDHLLRQISQQVRIRQIKPKRMNFY